MYARVVAGLAVLVLAVVGLTSPALAELPPGGTFFDDDGSVHEGAIEAIAAAAITAGCDGLGERFCPDRAVTRAEMATFLVRATGVSSQKPMRFVDTQGVHQGSIGAVEAAGWFKGCNPPVNDLFCPDRVLTRGEAAAVLTRAFDLPAVSGSGFIDVAGSVFEADIGALAAAGVTRGCDPPVDDRFCPDRPVSRGEMATFLTRLMGLHPDTPEKPFEGRIALGLLGGHLHNGGIATMEGDRDPKVLVGATVGLPDLSPDGQLVVYRDEARVCPSQTSTWWECYDRIFTIPFTGGAERQMTPNELRHSGFAWIPESESVGFAASWGNGSSEDDWFVAKVDTGSPPVVDVVAESSDYSLRSAAWSATGEIATTAHKPGDRTVLLVLDEDGSEQSVIAVADADIGGASWSPDGELLAYVIYRGNNSELVVSAPDGTNRHVVASGDGVHPYRWSPDGSRFAFATSYPAALVVCAGDGSDCATVAELENPFDLAWSPDGSVLAYIDSHRAWAIPVSGGDAWPLTPSDEWVVSLDWVG